MKSPYPEEWPQFFTASVVDWKPLFKEDKYKDIIIDALRFTVKENRIRLSAFVIMSTHIHIVWQQLTPFTKSQVQLGFMKYTAQKIKFDLQVNNSQFLSEFKVDLKDREYMFWQRRPLSVELFSPEVMQQKIDYIPARPVRRAL